MKVKVKERKIIKDCNKIIAKIDILFKMKLRMNGPRPTTIPRKRRKKRKEKTEFLCDKKNYFTTKQQ